ncbi:MAG: hypothetical protein QGH60_25300, partial [Phycisphaerae bacterium]|nr:hypothetical protein [Phycisphaerae bacterium]
IPDLADTIDETERFGMLDCVMMLARASRQENPEKAMRDLLCDETVPARTNWKAVDWDKILLKMNPWYDSFTAAAGRKTFKARIDALDDHDRRVKIFGAKVGKPRSFLRSILGSSGDPTEEVGNTLITLLMPSLGRAVELRDRAATKGDLALVAMALAAYKAEKKTYPDKLSQLSPGYLKK